MKKITRRWLFNSFGLILIILMALEILFAVGIKGFFYNSVEQAINSRANVVLTLLKNYSEDSSANFSAEVRGAVERFEDKEKMELMAINSRGEVIITSSGFDTREKMYMPDYQDALVSNDGKGAYRGVINGENVIALSFLVPVTNEDLSAVRFVVSLTDVDKQIITTIIVITIIGIAIIFFVILSSSYFINSIVIPVGQVGSTARKIAEGNFGVRLEKKNDDEIGELCDIINYMAEELSKADALKNDFISSVSHELRTPLTAIKGWGETLMLDGGEDKETLKKGMHVIMSETDRLSSMVEELLDFSRMQSGRLKLIKSKMDILAELSEAVLMYTERAKRENIELIYDEPEIFAAVFGDKNRLRQVFVNVIDNALKYSDEGGSVEVRARIMNELMVIDIEDKGCGISAVDLPKIKNKFYKANLTRRGSGIGLAVADEIVSMHGGKLELASIEGEGTTVTISLPIIDKKSDDATEIMQ